MGAKVYWAARDLDGPPVGNHQFILIVFDPPPPPPTHGIPVLREAGTQFITLGAFKKNGNLVFEANQSADVQAVREGLNPSAHVHWYASDFDIERHRITSTSGGGMRFAGRLMELAQNYARNTRGSPIAYSLVDENCAAWVNSLFKEAGVSASVRLSSGEFSGVDWGEEDTVPARLFR